MSATFSLGIFRTQTSKCYLREMKPGSVIMSDGFNLLDAMSAFEVRYISQSLRSLLLAELAAFEDR